MCDPHVDFCHLFCRSPGENDFHSDPVFFSANFSCEPSYILKKRFCSIQNGPVFLFVIYLWMEFSVYFQFYGKLVGGKRCVSPFVGRRHSLRFPLSLWRPCPCTLDRIVPRRHNKFSFFSTITFLLRYYDIHNFCFEYNVHVRFLEVIEDVRFLLFLFYFFLYNWEMKKLLRRLCWSTVTYLFRHCTKVLIECGKFPRQRQRILNFG